MPGIQDLCTVTYSSQNIQTRQRANQNHCNWRDWQHQTVYELFWHEWIKLCCATIAFSADPLVLGNYLGPSIDIEPAMTANILTLMDTVIHCCTYKSHIPKELADSVEQDHMKAFLQMAKDWWGSCLAYRQLEEVGLADTPDPEPYLENKPTVLTFPALIGNGLACSLENLRTHLRTLDICLHPRIFWKMTLAPKSFKDICPVLLLLEDIIKNLSNSEKFLEINKNYIYILLSKIYPKCNKNSIVL